MSAAQGRLRGHDGHDGHDPALQRRVTVVIYAVIGVAALIATRGHAPVLTVAGVLGAVGLFHALLVIAEARDAAAEHPLVSTSGADGTAR